MPLYNPQNPVLVETRAPDTDIDIPASWVGRYNRLDIIDAVELTLQTTTTAQANAEIIIRNVSTSTESATIVAGAGVTIDVHNSLGLSVPPGGIGELKRDGVTNNWDFYGYIV